MQLTAAVEADYGAIAELANLAYRGSSEAVGWSSEGEFLQGPRLTVDQLQRNLAKKPEARLLLFRDVAERPLLGTVWLEPAAGDTWYLGLLTVRPDLQNRSLGRALLEAAHEFARQRGARRMRITVLNVRGPLIAWYERRGYVRTGEVQPFPYGDERLGKPLRDDLAFVVLERLLSDD